jgi:hypothetical protein
VKGARSVRGAFNTAVALTADRQSEAGAARLIIAARATSPPSPVAEAHKTGRLTVRVSDREVRRRVIYQMTPGGDSGPG